LESQHVSDDAIHKRLYDQRGKLEQELESLKGREAQLQELVIPGDVNAPGVANLSRTEEYLREADLGNSASSELISAINREINSLCFADANLAEAASGIDQAGRAVFSAKELAEKWMPEDYKQLQSRHTAMDKRLKKAREEIGAGADADALKEELESLKRDALLLTEKAGLIASDAESREDRQRRRIYVLKALRSVCASLGFHELEEPHYEKPGNPNTDVLHRYDTLNRGVVSFRLRLDGRIESDSQISLDVCSEEHERITSLMLEEFGVATEFRRVTDDDKPEVIDSKRKPMPRKQEPHRMEGGA
jgi:hypothetical protein